MWYTLSNKVVHIILKTGTNNSSTVEQMILCVLTIYTAVFHTNT